MEPLAGTNITFIGGGAMAEAMLRGILAGGRAQPGQLTVAEPLAARRDVLREALGVTTVSDNAQAAGGADIVVLAVKPQVAERALAPLRGALRPEALVISIIAGVRIAALERLIGAPAIVRVMPNTPAQVREGMSVWTATSAVTEAQRDQARAILGALGQEIGVEDEGYVDMATAISGSGPAYVFLFIEALTDAGVQLGLPRAIAEALALQTMRGSAIYAQTAGQHPAILRNAVTSPGGTTAAALYELERGGLRATLTQAVLAAYARAKQLGGTDSA